MSVSVNLKSYFYEVLIPSSQKNTSSPIEDILHHVSKYIFYEKACALQMFQSTHPHGVRRLTGSNIMTALMFQSTHPHGVRLQASYIPENLLCFNPRTHTGCDPSCIMTSPSLSVFQSTHPHGVRHISTEISMSFILCFNPRTHTGCDGIIYPTSIAINRFQSTHPHGVRLNSSYFLPSQTWFQSTHPHGVRLSRISVYLVSHSFNPRTHTGCDMPYLSFIVRMDVSIHAPTRGATLQYLCQLCDQACFNPRTHTGCDPGEYLSFYLL